MNLEEKDIRILISLATVVPKLSDLEKGILLGHGENMAANKSQNVPVKKATPQHTA